MRLKDLENQKSPYQHRESIGDFDKAKGLVEQQSVSNCCEAQVTEMGAQYICCQCLKPCEVKVNL